jgi:ABC-type nitrate/sulfonate/bicarbonate transport system permease component
MNSLRRALLPAATMIAFVCLAQLAVVAGWTPRTVASPSQIAGGVMANWSVLWHHLEPTLLVAVTGYLLALLVSLALAALVTIYRRIEPTVMTIGTVIDSVPMIALAPVLVIWMGLTLPMRITITTVICFFPIFVSLVQGLKAPPTSAEELFVNLAASPMQRFRLLAFPYALPYLFVGLKISAPLAVLGALIAEWTGAERGLGVFMLNAMFGLKVIELWSAVIVACAVSASAFLLVSLFELLSVTDRGQREVGT